MQRLLIIFLLLLSGITSQGQSLNSIGAMPTLDFSGNISKKWGFSLYYFGMFNLYNDEVAAKKSPSELFALYSEQAISFAATEKLSLTGSYVYERQRPLTNGYRNENRFYLQATYKYHLGSTSVKHRLRFDGRFIQDRVTGNAPFTHRVRYLTGIQTLLVKNGKSYVSAYNEFFFNTSKGSPVIYGENWAYAALGFKTGKSSSIETGPLYVFWVTDAKSTLRNFYYLQLTWISSLNFKSK